jgi:membrane glycosyltransferase
MSGESVIALMGHSLRDAGLAFVPAENPLPMPAQEFARRSDVLSARGSQEAWVQRAALFAGASLLTAGFAYELHAVLSFVRMTPIQFLFLVLSTLAFGWIAFGSVSAALGFLPLFGGEPADTIALPDPDRRPAQRTALLFPIYHEEPAQIAGTIEAIAEDLALRGDAGAFDVFVLSDSRKPEAGEVEEAVFAALRERLAPILPVYYRRRIENTARKAGNIKEWVQRFGGAYENFVVFDADSVMSAEVLVRLALAMEGRPRVGLIQTVPRLVGGRSIFQRLQQYAAAVYGPAVGAGLAAWHHGQGNYWGHNAIIRTAAFAGAAGLPELAGRPPFGGHIQSHDFVEAVLLQRAGWEVHMVPALEGSYEGLPPGLVELVARDRRWAQGNLQHLAIVARPGLTPMGRIHLAMGAASYIVSVVWAASLAVGVVLALQGQQVIPSYFRDAKTLFPIWPVIDPGAAFRLFLATMAVVLMPKVLGLVLEIRRALATGAAWRAPRLTAGVLTETLFSMLLAPVMMMTQTMAVAQILAGHDSGWSAQRRGHGRISLGAAIAFHQWHMLVGAVLTGLCFTVSYELAAWMGPVILGLLLSAAMTWWTARPAGAVLSAVLATREDIDPPDILARSSVHSANWTRSLASGELLEAGDLAKAA